MTMKDVLQAKFVQVLWSEDKTKLWVNTEFGCVLRIQNIERVEP